MEYMADPDIDATRWGIGERIKHLRDLRGLSQEKFGEKVGVTQQYVGALESGKRNPGPALVFMISKKFSTSEAWLREGGK